MEQELAELKLRIQGIKDVLSEERCRKIGKFLNDINKVHSTIADAIHAPKGHPVRSGILTAERGLIELLDSLESPSENLSKPADTCPITNRVCPLGGVALEMVSELKISNLYASSKN